MNKTNKWVRGACLLLCCALTLSGCGIVILTESEDTETLPEAPETTTVIETQPTLETTAAPEKIENDYGPYADAYLAQVMDCDYKLDGTTIFIATPRTDILFPVDEDTTSAYAKNTRNSKVEEVLGIRLASIALDETSCLDTVRVSVEADEYFSDILMLPQNLIGAFAVNGILLNLKSAPFLDFSKPYFSQDSADATTANGRTYAIAGDASYETSTLNAIYFNRGLMEANHLELPYASVYDGTWTWDKFFQYTTAVSTLDTSARVSSYSYQYSADMLAASVFFSTNGKFVDQREGAPTLAYSFSSDSSRAAVITQLFNESNRHKDTSTGVSRFHNGQSLFLLDRLYLMSWMPDSEQNWGIVPFPKMTETQKEYVSLSADSALFFAAQINTTDVAKVALLISALNAASYRVISDAYVNYAVNHLLRDNDSANMLDIIIASRTYDFAYSFSNVTASLYSAVISGFSDLANGAQFKIICDRIPRASTDLATKYS